MNRRHTMLRNLAGPSLTIIALAAAAACRPQAPADRVRASGHVEATDVQVAAEVGGRLLELKVDEGDRVQVGDLIARLDTTNVDLALRRARAERAQADAQLRLLLAGSRIEDIRQAEAQVASADTEIAATRADLTSAAVDLERFESLLKSNSGSQKQRDDASTRRKVAEERLAGAEQRALAASEALARLKAGARREEIDAARARLAAADAQVATLEQNVADASLKSPVAGIVTQKLADVGEVLVPRAPIVVVTDLDRAWANVYIDEPAVPRVRVGQPATVFTDAGGAGLPGTITYISPKAEFTPRNVQTSEERSKLVYRIKVSVDNREGILKQGMPVEAELLLQEAK
jgi:HlyD family secretion protein